MKTSSKLAATLILCAATAAAMCGIAEAQAMFFPGPWPPAPPVEDAASEFHVKTTHAQIVIDNGVAKTTSEHVVRNDSRRDIEATFLFPVPEGAAITGWELDIDGKMTPGKVLDKKEARKIYEEIVRRQKDPALLEFAGRGMFRASVYPIPARGERRVALSYTETLNASGNAYRYTYPIPASGGATAPASVNVKIKSARPIVNIYSPSHQVSVHRDGERSAEVGFEVSGSSPRVDFELFYSVSDDDIGLTLLTHKDFADGSFFMLTASPRVEFAEDDAEPRDVVFVFDKTGSMSGDKIEQARAALKFCLRGLKNADRFNVIPFSERAEPLFEKLEPASGAAISKSLSEADAMRALGGTNIDAALDAAFRMNFDPARPAYVIFMTDGLPTVGVTDVKTILENAAARAPRNVRLFAFGVGFDVNTRLLDRLSAENRGVAEYVRPEEDIEVKVSALFRMISAPALTNIKIDFGSMNAFDALPLSLPDIFYGSQIMVTGRFSGKPGAVRLTGSAGGARREFVLNEPSSVGDNAFIPQLWATRRIGALIEEIRRNGEQRDIINEISSLSRKYGIITEYTSYLVEEPTLRLSAGPAAREREMMIMEVRTKEAADAVSGAWGVNQSMAASALANADAPVAGPQRFRDRNDNVTTITGVRSVRGRAFFLDSGEWNDARYTKDISNEIRVKPYSEAQFALLREMPELGAFFALGEKVTIVLGDIALRVSPDGADTITEEQLMYLVARRDRL